MELHGPAFDETLIKVKGSWRTLEDQAVSTKESIFSVTHGMTFSKASYFLQHLLPLASIVIFMTILISTVSVTAILSTSQTSVYSPIFYYILKSQHHL